MASAEYLAQVRRLLHDASGNYWSDSELLDDINQARNRISMDTGSVRSLVNFNLSFNQESYPFMGAAANLSIASAGTLYTAAPTIGFSGGGGSGATATAAITSGTLSSVTITANGTGYTAAPTISVTGGTVGTTASVTATIMSAFDIMSITVNYNNSWITLAYTYFSEFQAKARYYRSITGQPALWSKGPPATTAGGDVFYIFQIPSASYQCDIDATMLPNPLIDDTTPEQLKYPYTDLVQYYTAYLAKYKQQEFNDSANFLRIYDELWRRGSAMRYQRRIPNAY